MKRYSKAELQQALNLIENGSSFSEVAKETGINKSILARENRKRKNEKADRNMNRDSERILKENLVLFEKINLQKLID
ncbi:hypothetical protein JK636_23090 [Clostridium sp. YIM B02515]|uniref:Transposase IS30-like HTH domain-containing protein n=1 Tax=Clostridium rhizosphaerae TaxID=2803861 RepID=A0ABS1TGU1_9CLOT|nr:hypothetical protein [Clostridium rhizosphaerae]MBL4938594.1 hypothetical protein [Clostridium rhizosphaerae]